MEIIQTPGCQSNRDSLWLNRRLLTRVSGIAIFLFAATAFAAGAQDAPPAAKPDAAKQASTTPPSATQPAGTSTNAADAQANAQDPQSKAQADAAVDARKRQFAEDAAQLLKLANDLKEAINKTDKDTLSLAVIRKADEIEKLAHSVQNQ
jgi:hypothetical protein